jgi:hypothetical protein
VGDARSAGSERELGRWAAISPVDGGEGEIWEMGGNFGQILSES